MQPSSKAKTLAHSLCLLLCVSKQNNQQAKSLSRLCLNFLFHADSDVAVACPSYSCFLWDETAQNLVCTVHLQVAGEEGDSCSQKGQCK